MVPAAHRELALALAGQFPDERFNFIEIDRSPHPSWRVAALADVASDLVILWSAELEASPQLPWLLSPDFLDRLVNVSRVAVLVFRLDDAMPPLDLLAFSMGGISDERFIARALRGLPPVRPAGDSFLGRSEWEPKFDRVFYSARLGMLWIHGLAGIGKRTEGALGGPVDMEWAMGPGPDGPRHLYLLQARPETVWSTREAEPVAPPATTAVDRMVAMMLGRSGGRR